MVLSLGGNWVGQFTSLPSQPGQALPGYLNQCIMQQGVWSALLLSCPPVRLTHPHTTRASSTVYPRQGAGPTLQIAAVGVEQDQLYCSHAPQGRLSCLLHVARGREEGIFSSPLPPHGLQGRGRRPLCCSLSCPQDWLTCTSTNRVSSSVLPG